MGEWMKPRTLKHIGPQFISACHVRCFLGQGTSSSLLVPRTPFDDVITHVLIITSNLLSLCSYIVAILSTISENENALISNDVTLHNYT